MFYYDEPVVDSEVFNLTLIIETMQIRQTFARNIIVANFGSDLNDDGRLAETGFQHSLIHSGQQIKHH